MAGQPTKMTESTLKLLQEAFEWGCPDHEACLHAGISHTTLYNYQEKHPEYVERKKTLKEHPTLKARRILQKELDEGNGNTAKWYLERKNKDEFSPRTDLKHQGDPDNPLKTTIQVEFTKSYDKTQERIDEILENETKPTTK